MFRKIIYSGVVGGGETLSPFEKLMGEHRPPLNFKSQCHLQYDTTKS